MFSFAKMLVLPLFLVLIAILAICEQFIWGRVFQQSRYDKLAKLLPQKTFEFFYMLSGKRYRNLTYTGSYVFLGVSLIASTTIFVCIFVFRLTDVYYGIIGGVILAQAGIIFCVVLVIFGIRKRFDKLVIKVKGISPKIGLLDLIGWPVGNHRFRKSITFLTRSVQLDLAQRQVNKKILQAFCYLLCFVSQKLVVINPWLKRMAKLKFTSENKKLEPDILREIKKFDEILLDCKFEIKILRLCPYPIGNCRLTKSFGLNETV